MGAIWHDYLYYPLFNVLLWLYNGPAMSNLGIAVIELTVMLRIVLLPFTIIDERNRYKYEQVSLKVAAINHDFKADPIKAKEVIRDLLKEHRVSYWAKVFVLGVQAAVLVVLYQVFIAGIRFTLEEQLYAWVTPPASVNTVFLGFDIAQKSVLWPAFVGGLLFIQIYSVFKKRESLVTRADVMYMVLFPLFSTGVLLLLPMVKSVFILTSMFFSMAVFWLRQAFFPQKAE